jgi:pyruvate kinase
VSDALMVARGDLGIEMPLESLPAVQKKLIRAARRRGVPAIVATQVLESMITETRPTRAEVTDAAHAVEEGADAIMLAAETASGKHPIRAVSTLDLIVREAEKMLDPLAPDRHLALDDRTWSEHARGLCQAAVTLADRAHASAIVAVTEAGKTARLLAALRPAATILAATPNSATAARLALVWGVTPVVTEDLSLERLRATLTTRGLVSPGAVVVFVAIHPVLGRDDTNFLHVERL